MTLRRIGKIDIQAKVSGNDTVSTGFVFYSYAKNSNALEFHFKDQQGRPVDLLGTKVRLLLIVKDNGEDKEFKTLDEEIVTESSLNGIVRYIIPDRLMGYQGIVDGWIYLDFPDGSKTDEVHFKFTIERSKIDQEAPLIRDFYVPLFEEIVDSIKAELSSDAGKAKNDISQMVIDTQKISQEEQEKIQAELPKLQETLEAEYSELYRLFNDYIASSKLTWQDFMDSESESWKNFIDQNREVIESIDPGGVVLTELIDARGSVDGVTHPNLKARLDNKEQEFNAQLAQTEKKLEGFFNVKWFGAKGDGHTDDTVAIQTALDTARGTLFFPQGNYKVTGTGEACLYLNKKINLVGADANFSRIRADNASATTSVLKVAITDNYGFLDVRNWKIEGLGLAVNGGGLHSLLIKDGMQLLTCEIKHCNLQASTANGGFSIYVENNLAHSKITLNTISHGVFMKCYDANLIEKNLFLGTRVAVTYDLITGVYNNTVRDNTLVNRDGAVRIINGSLVRIVNNQIELMQGQGTNQSATRSMVWVEGKDRSCDNIIIEENNFGGGTSLDHLIYIDNAHKAVLSKNHFVSTNIAEVVFTDKSRYCILKQDNRVRSETSNPRTRTAFKAEVIDNGVGTVGVLKQVAHQNNWNSGDFYKDENGMVHFYRTFSGGSVLTANSVIGTLPVGFRPIHEMYLPSASSGGSCLIEINASGVIKATTTIPSNYRLTLPSFPTNTTE